MILSIQASDLTPLLDLKQHWLAESGRMHLPVDWRKNTLARYEHLYREGRCQHVAWRSEHRVVALAGAVFMDDTPFLSTREKCYALLTDEYVLPDFRRQGLEGRLRDALLTIVAERGAVLCAELPANLTRLTALAAGNLRF